MVRVYDPSGVISDVGTVRSVVTVPPGGGVTVNGEKLPTEPGGVPVACNWIGEEKLPTEVRLIV